MISDQQLALIRRAIRQGEITNNALQDDLIDHFCCLVEEKMHGGQSFENAFQAAYQQIAPNGFAEIQEETRYLLNHKKRLRLHQCTYLLGYVFALSATIGAFFKIMYLPGASPLVQGGVLGLALVFLPLLLLTKLKNWRFFYHSAKHQWILGFLSALVLLTAGLFKVQQLQGAGILLGLGFLLVGFGFLPLFFFRMFKASAFEG